MLDGFQATGNAQVSRTAETLEDQVVLGGTYMHNHQLNKATKFSVFISQAMHNNDLKPKKGDV